jgi:hypothetical protein
MVVADATFQRTSIKQKTRLPQHQKSGALPHIMTNALAPEAWARRWYDYCLFPHD